MRHNLKFISVIKMKAKVYVTLKPSVLDPQGKAIQHSVELLGYKQIADVRQGKYGPVVFPPHQDPTFAELYTHTEGRLFNGGVKIRF